MCIARVEVHRVLRVHPQGTNDRLISFCLVGHRETSRQILKGIDAEWMISSWEPDNLCMDSLTASFETWC